MPYFSARRSVLCFARLICLSVLATILAQDPEVIFRSNVRLKEITVIAVGKNGKSVQNLTTDDFEILENGKRRDIKSFLIQQREDLVEGQLANGTLTTNGIFANRSISSEIGGAHSVILLDWLNTGLPDRAFATQKLQKMIAELRPTDQIAIYVLERKLRIVHDFTSDRQALAEALRNLRSTADLPPVIGSRLRYDASIGPKSMLPVDSAFAALDFQGRADFTRIALEQINERVAGIRGRKNLIWLSAHFAPNWSNRIPGIAVYPVDARGLMGIASEEANLLRQLNLPGIESVARQIEQKESGETQQLIAAAKATGGRAFMGRNDLDGIMRTILDDASYSYTLGYSPAEPLNPGTRAIRVRTPRKGVALRYRETYVVEKSMKLTPAQQSERIIDALSRPLDVTEIAFIATATRTGQSIRLTVQVAPGDIALHPDGSSWKTDLSIATVCSQADGSRVGEPLLRNFHLSYSGDGYRLVLSEGLRFGVENPCPDTARTVRLLIRESLSGSLGTVTVPIE